MAKAKTPTITAADWLRAFIHEEWEGDTVGFARNCGLSPTAVYRLLRTGKTNSLRVAVAIESATRGVITPGEWL